MPQKVVSQVDVTTYPALFRRVKETLLDGQRRIEEEKVRTYWETGKLIQTHILANNNRAEYGKEVLPRLSGDLDVSEAVLYRCLQFFNKYPDIKKVARAREFTWSHYQELLGVSDDGKRLQLEQEITRGGLTRDEVRARKRAFAVNDESQEAKDVPVARPLSAALVPIRGQLYTYQIMKRKVLAVGASDLVVDLGFSTVHNVDPRSLSNFSAGDIVASLPKEDAYRFYKVTKEGLGVRVWGLEKAADPKPYSLVPSPSRLTDLLYTYKALVEKVVDADTLKVHIDLGFNVWVRQTLRLRGIDAPEVGTKDGDQAKAFVQSLLKEADEITIRSSRSDKYDRYLADVFIAQAEGAEIFLNNLLLEKELAERVA